jgi:PII-like signaling protein
MRGIEGEQVLVRIYLGRSRRAADHRPLFRQLLALLRQEGLAGATVLRGWAGYGHDRQVHTATIECASFDLPVVIETVDSPEHVEQLLAKIDAVMTGGLVMTERAHVVRYGTGS